MPSEIDRQLQKKAPCSHVPFYDEAVDETYCQKCLERLPNETTAVVIPRAGTYAFFLVLSFAIGMAVGASIMYFLFYGT